MVVTTIKGRHKGKEKVVWRREETRERVTSSSRERAPTAIILIGGKDDEIKERCHHHRRLLPPSRPRPDPVPTLSAPRVSRPRPHSGPLQRSGSCGFCTVERKFSLHCQYRFLWSLFS